MDLDFVLEKGGRVLIMENKPGGAPLPFGQMLTLRTFVRMGCEVWVVWESEDKKSCPVGTMTRSGAVPFKEKMPVARLKKRVLDWRHDALEEGQ